MAAPQQQQHLDSVELLNAGYVPDQRGYNGWQESTAYNGAGTFYHDGYVVSPVSEYPQDATTNNMNNFAGNINTQQQQDAYSKEPLQQVQLHPIANYPQPPIPYQSNSLRKSWGVEMLSALFSILCVVAMVIILYKIDGRVLSTWTIAVSPNAFISVLSTASKAAMILPVAESLSQLKWLYLERRGMSLEHLQVFDDASRGPWGALKFFLFARKATFIAYVGCLVTIAAIALDPFTQQILSFGQMPTQVPDLSSSVTRSQAYDNQDKGLNGVGNVMSSTRDGKLQAAAISGLYDLVPAPPFSCPGSNCTYPTFTSLGIHNECNDVTKDTLQHCIQTNSSVYRQMCNYTLPSGIRIGAYAGSDAHNGFYHTTINVTVNRTNPEPGILNLIRLGMIWFTDDDLDQNFEVSTDWQKTLTAYECSYEVNAFVYSNWTSVNGTVQPGALQRARLNLTDQGPIVPAEALDPDFPGNKTFVLNYADYNFMADCVAIVANDYDGQATSYTEALYNSPDINKTMQNMATGMSYRMLSGPNATTVEGEVFAVQTFIHVHWAWLALTVTLVLIACLFFITVVVQTQIARQRAWKSSLAPLLYDVPASAVDGSGKPDWPQNFKHVRTRTIVEQLRSPI